MHSPYEGVTQQTIEDIAKSTEGILAGTGIQGIDLSGLVALVPVNVPARNNTSAFPRTVAGMGSKVAQWKALLNINSEQADVATGFDYAGKLAKIKEQEVFAPYKPMASGGRVTLDAVAINRNYADVLAVDQLQTLNQLFIGQDIHLINSQNWELGKTSTPTLTVAKVAGKGKLKKSKKYKVCCVPKSGANYFYGGQGIKSTEEEIEATDASEESAITAKVKALKGAVAYDWYFGEEGKELWYYTTTTVAEATFYEVLTKANALPSLPLLSTKEPSKHPTTEDKSSSANWYNGVIASILGNYGTESLVAPTSGTESGSVFIDNEGKELEASGSSVKVLDELFEQIWNSVQLSPTALMMNTQQGESLSKLLLEGSIATTFLPPTEADARTNLAGGGFIGRYINKAVGGVAVPIEVHPHLAPGTIIARTDRVPYPGSNIGSVFEVACQYDTMQFDYAASRGSGEGEGPRYDFEIRSMETLKCHAPNAQGIISNVKINANV